MQRWASGVGFHKFEAPHKRLILMRLREKYADRIKARTAPTNGDT